MVGLMPVVVLVEVDRVHLNEVDDARELVLGTDRKLQEYRTGTEAVLHHADDVHEVRAGAVHLVDVRDARNAVRVGLAPDGLRLRLNATHGAEDRDGAVEHAQRALDFDREVHVAGRIYDLNAMVFPEARRRGRRDRDAALLLLHHPVHRGSAIMDLADLVRLACVEQDSLGRRGLTGIDMSHDPDVAGLGEWESL